MFDIRYYNDITYSKKDPKLVFEDFKKECIHQYKDPKAAKITYNDFILASNRAKINETHKYDTSNAIFYILKELNSK